MPVSLPAEGPLRRIGVFRALMLGDLLCAVPALRALRAAHPQAEITFIGLPWARELMLRMPMVDRFIDFPGFPGLPEAAVDQGSVPEFLHMMQREQFDLLLQMHGSGRIVNPLIAACGARRSAGFYEPGAFCPQPELYTVWPNEGHEVQRLLRLLDHLGVARQGEELEFPLRSQDFAELQAVWPEAGSDSPYVVVHAGARLPSRRWPVQRFAAVADRLARQGCTVVLTGSAGEAPLVAELQAQMKQPSVNLAGRTTLWTLGALVARARLLLCNDTGISHVGAALATPSVVVASGSEVSRWRPLGRGSHQVLWQAMDCRPCHNVQCPTGHACALAIGVAEVAAACEGRLAASLEQPRPVPRVFS
ncbi:glycosyltransferase family 9 protein [Azohydromonas caseinilytica]|uniref:Glycosyltransferase family 9 protein n=1 Tax=Azohydromonas caseinilytica TaxID=2728836 RepID=A0A848F5G4_9BURK|nr:glycosyltransferase family 9 protein [Azohydromonas caseinilytica]NML13540.1 glycosyltransferase family 9 protein [Azohydromonas caseinilytica]